ncbi:MAG: hypothetical protein QM775_00055 [Pirellulales bacterium]
MLPMLGQGRPLAVLARRLVAVCGLIGACGCALLVVAAEVPEPANDKARQSPVEIRLRIEWGGGEACSFAGLIGVAGGELSDFVALGMEPDVPGSSYLDDGELHLVPRGPRTYDGVDVTVTAEADAKLAIRLQSTSTTGATATRAIEVPLAGVVQQTSITELPELGGNRISVRRAPGDRLQAALDRDHVIFTPGELLELKIRPHLLGYESGTALRLTAALHRARQSKALWNDTTDLAVPDDDGAWPTVPLSLHLPDEEGVYDVVLELARRDLSSRLHIAGPTERRKLQIVVLSQQPPSRRSQTVADPPVLEEIDPASPGWWDRARSAALPPALRGGPLGNCRIQGRRTSAGLFVELPPSADALGRPLVDDLTWQAYPFTVSRPGAPHFLEIEYPSDVAQSLGISMFEPDAAGALRPISVDQGLFVDASETSGPARRLTKRFVVWPQTATPLVVVMNRRHDAPAAYGKLRLLGPRAAPLVARPWQTDDFASLPHVHLPDSRAEGRLLAAYFDRPKFTEAFSQDSAGDEYGPDAARPLDDWLTFYEGARRVVEYLTFAGYNGAIVTVASEGSAIYPSELPRALFTT